MDSVIRIDPFCRDEGGRFVPKPVKVLAPMVIVDLANGTVRPEFPVQWVARRVRMYDGTWRVVFVQEIS